MSVSYPFGLFATEMSPRGSLSRKGLTCEVICSEVTVENRDGLSYRRAVQALHRPTHSSLSADVEKPRKRRM